MGLFVLRVQDLPDGLSDYRFELTPGWLRDQLKGLEGIIASDETGSAELTATKRGTEVLVQGTVTSCLDVTCVRCLEVFRLEVRVPLDVLMLPGKPAGTESDDEDPEDLSIERYQGGEIVLDDLLRDTILLEVPMSPNCGESCPGWDRLKGDAVAPGEREDRSE